MPTALIRTAAAALLAAALAALAGCAPAAEPAPSDPAAEPAPSDPATDAVPSTPTTGAALPLPDRIPDPRALTGLSEAAPAPPIVPVDDDPAVALPVTVTGDDGVATTVASIDRIVTLDIYGTTSQTLIGLGLADRVAGRTISDADPALAGVPTVNAEGHAVDVEAVLAVAPTLVLADTTLGPATSIRLLRDSGIPVVVLDPDRGARLIAEQIRAIAAATGVPEAGEALVERTERELDEVREYIAGLTAGVDEPLRLAVLYVRGTAGVFFVFGEGSAAGALIDDLGGDHVAAGAGLGETVPATAEALISIDPEVLLVMADGLDSTGGPAGLAARPGIAQTTAGAAERIVAVPDGQLVSFGPNYPAALKSIADAIHLG